jgi:hypothetical protein
MALKKEFDINILTKPSKPNSNYHQIDTRTTMENKVDNDAIHFQPLIRKRKKMKESTVICCIL